MGGVYYNEIEPGAVALMREMMRRGVIADGEIDTRSIVDVQPDDLCGFAQCHFFSGLGGWSYAARLAGWGDDRPLWSGSAPCQPFSTAGEGRGTADERHLWPHLFRLARAAAARWRRRGGQPFVLVGEQVAGSAGDAWLDGVRADLESSRFAFRSVEVPACAVNAPHQRQRNYWVGLAGGSLGDATSEGLPGGALPGVCGSAESRGAWDAEPKRRNGPNGGVLADGSSRRRGCDDECRHAKPGHACAANEGCRDVADGASRERDRGASEPRRRSKGRIVARRGNEGGALGDADFDRQHEPGRIVGESGRWAWDAIARNGALGRDFYAGAEWIACHDGKARRVADAGAPLLVNGFPNRVLGWRAFGNAIHAILASEVLASLIDVLPEWEG